jgi:hypothetical protein
MVCACPTFDSGAVVGPIEAAQFYFVMFNLASFSCLKPKYSSPRLRQSAHADDSARVFQEPFAGTDRAR